MLAKERAKIWATDPHFDEKTREAAAQMLENEEELLTPSGRSWPSAPAVCGACWAWAPIE